MFHHRLTTSPPPLPWYMTDRGSARRTNEDVAGLPSPARTHPKGDRTSVKRGMHPPKQCSVAPPAHRSIKAEYSHTPPPKRTCETRQAEIPRNDADEAVGIDESDGVVVEISNIDAACAIRGDAEHSVQLCGSRRPPISCHEGRATRQGTSAQGGTHLDSSTPTPTHRSNPPSRCQQVR